MEQGADNDEGSNTSDIVSSWLDLFNKYVSSEGSNEVLSPQDLVVQGTELERIFFEFLSTTAPKLIKETNINDLLRYIINDQEFQESLSSKFDAFICASSEEISIDTLIVSYSKPALHCGHVFKRGDLLYSCKTCARDPSCVLCSLCFNNSVHTEHRIKLRTSEGIGGYCDCGDEESWKTGAACAQHSNYDTDGTDTTDPFSDFPDDLQHRSTFIFKFLLQYFMQLLDMEQYSDDDTHIIPNISGGDNSLYFLMLYNDESHSYDEIIYALERALTCDEQRAIQYSDIIDKEGRCPIFKGSLDECKILVEEVKYHGDESLKCRVISHTVLIHQMVALHLMSWMSNLIRLSEGFRRLFCHLTVSKISGIRGEWPQTLLETIIRLDSTLWKTARHTSHRLFMDNVLLDSVGKKSFAVTFARCYKQIVESVLEDDHDLTLSVAICSVQILTVPSLAKMLLVNETLLKTILTLYLEHLQPAVGKKATLDFNKMEDESGLDLERLNFMLVDVFYILQYTPVWGNDEALKTSFLDAFAVFVEILKLMQGMDNVKRKRRGHVDYDLDWEDALELQSAMMPVMRLMIIWCSSNEEILKSAITLCLSALKSCNTLKYTTIKGNTVTQHIVRRNSTSFHYELSRFLGCLLCRLSDWNSCLSDVIHSKKTEENELILIDYSLRALVLCAQVNANMWLRNGESMKQISELYRCSKWGYDRDILMAQIVGSVMEPDNFIDVLLHKYEIQRNIDKVSSSAGCFKNRNTNNTDEDEERKDRTTVISEFLLTVFHILSERHVLGVGEVTSRDILEREIVHQLCLGPTPRSTLITGLAIGDEDDEDDIDDAMLDDILNSVAVYREPGPKEKGTFALKDDKWTLCNRFFIHYTKAERTKMREEQIKVRKRTSREDEAFLHPPPLFKKNFQNVTRLLCSQSLHKIMRTILIKAVKGYPGCHDQVSVIFMIIALGLIESKRMRNASASIDFDFVHYLTVENRKKKHNRKNMVNLIDDVLGCSDSKDYSQLGKWVKRLLREEMRQQGIVTVNVSVSEETSKSTEDEEKAEKLRKAAERKRFMMEQMSKLQINFAQSNSKLLDDIAKEEEEEEENSLNTQQKCDISSPIAIGVNHSASTRNNQCSYSCILCQGKEVLDMKSFTNGGYTSFAVTTFLQKSTLLNTSGTNLPAGPSPGSRMNISSCGHVVHVQCWEKYFHALKQEAENDWHMEARLDVQHGEYMCPLCRSICNAVLPLVVNDSYSKNDNELQCFDTEQVLSRIKLRRDSSDAKKTTSSLALEESQSSVVHNEDPPSASEKLTISEEATIDQKTSIVLETTSENDREITQSGQKSSPSKSLESEKAAHEPPSEVISTSDVSGMFLKMLTDQCSTSNDTETNSLHIRQFSQAISYTIQCYECSTRDQRLNIFSTFSGRQDVFWNALMPYADKLSRQTENGLVQETHPELKIFLDDDSCERPSIIETDVFTLLVNLRLMRCDIDILRDSLDISATWVMDDVIFKLCLLAQLVKIYITAPFFPSEDKDEGTSDVIVKSWLHVQGLTTATYPLHVDGGALKKHVLKGLLPFLRCCSVFFRFLTGVSFPEKLTKGEGVEEMELEVKILLEYLDIRDPFDELLTVENMTSNSLTQQLIERWCKHNDVVARTLDSFHRCNAEPEKLMPLPKEYIVLLKRASDFYCPVLGDVSRTPSLCLFCNTMLCSDCYSCQSQLEEGERRIGACAMHSIECSGDVGVFLRIRDCDIVLMHRTNKGLLLPSLYLDEYGEYDRQLYRGNPLYLNEQRYENLQLLWLQHKIPDTIAQNMNQTPVSATAPVFVIWREL